MATDDIPTDGQPARLDSWKQIAEYLRRDVRTAMRWESQGLPLHRVGGSGRSVFAFTHEIDAWMARRPAEPEAEVVPIQPPTELPAQKPSAHTLRIAAVSAACTVAVIAIGAAVMSGGAAAGHESSRPDVTATAIHISVKDASGGSHVIHQFRPGAVLPEGGATRVEELDADGAPEILATVLYYDSQGGRLTASGELLDLSPAGDVRWRFAFDDAIEFAGGRVTSPWVITDWQAEADASLKRIAIAAHEERWWASLVTVLDHTGQRHGSFVNPGWIESVLWRSSDRLAIAGFYNPTDSAMFAVLDVSHLEGQAPSVAGTIYPCVSCSKVPPVFYATFPRSEVNVVAAGRFNRARVSTAGDRIIVATAEISSNGGDATAFYEFDHDLRLVGARYSDLYWTEHRRLELEGRIKHTREQCPDRDGPPAIQVWDAARGWVRTTAVAVPRP